MINLHRIKNPDISFRLIPWYVPNDQNRVQIGEELYRRLSTEPDDTFCVVIEEKGFCRGFIVAYMDKKNCFIWQARADLSVKNAVEKVWKELLEWSKEKGADKILMYPNGHTKAFKRKYGFKPNQNGSYELCLADNQNQVENLNNQVLQSVTHPNRSNG